MEQEQNNYWQQEDELVEEELVLDYEEYTDFNETQDNIYQSLYIAKVMKNDSIKFY